MARYERHSLVRVIENNAKRLQKLHADVALNVLIAERPFAIERE
jgi:hypothetical protein